MEYLSLKRNHKYIITITKALGIGYKSFSEALASYTVMSNLKFRLIHYDRDKVKDVVYNGQYMLGVGESEVASPSCPTPPASSAARDSNV